jgi:hypothetical protein
VAFCCGACRRRGAPAGAFCAFAGYSLLPCGVLGVREDAGRTGCAWRASSACRSFEGTSKHRTLHPERGQNFNYFRQDDGQGKASVGVAHTLKQACQGYGRDGACPFWALRNGGVSAFYAYIPLNIVHLLTRLPG